MRLGVLGTGRMAAYRARWLARRPQVDELLVGSRRPERAEELAAQVGGRGGGYEDVLSAELDALVIATATPEHVRQIEAGAARGLPMLCEKPVALSLEETERAITAAEAAGAALQVAFQRRFDPAWSAARDLVAEGALGTIYSIRIASHDHEPAPEHFIPGSGGIFRDLHVHDFDALRWVTGSEIERVYATGAVREWSRFAEHDDLDTSAVLLELRGGVPALVSGSRHDPRGYDFRADILGSRDAVAIGLDGRTPLRSLEPGAPAPTERPYSGFLDRFEGAFQAEMAAFLELAAGRGPNPCPPRESLEALRVAVACERSRALGTPVEMAW